MLSQNHISSCTLQRLPLYVSFLRSLPQGAAHVSSTEIANGLGLHPVQVRKDLAAVGSQGRPRIGYEIDGLTRHLTAYLGGSRQYTAALVGLGHLGRALTAHAAFADYGFAVKAVFDNNTALIGRRFAGHPVHNIETLADVCRKLEIPVGIITVPQSQAQQVCDLMVEGGVQVIWNFALTRLNVPEHVTVRNEDIAASLALMTQQILERPTDCAPIASRGGESA